MHIKFVKQVHINCGSECMVLGKTSNDYIIIYLMITSYSIIMQS